VDRKLIYKIEKWNGEQIPKQIFENSSDEELSSSVEGSGVGSYKPYLLRY
jgi:hypothetical protein